MSQLKDMTGNFAASQKYAEEALAITEKLDHTLGRAFAHKRIGRILHLQGDYDNAERHYRQSLSLNEADSGAKDVETNKVRMHLSTLLNHQQKYDEALAMLEQVYAIRQEHYPGDHGDYSEVFLATGSVLNSLGRYDEATAKYEEAFAMNERLFGPDNRRNLFIVNGLGGVAESRGDYALAASRYRDAVRLTRQYFPDHPNLGYATANLAKAYTLEDRWDLALPEFRAALELLERKVPDHWRVGEVRWRLGQCILQTGGDLAEAEALILAGIETLTAQWGPDHESVRDANAAAAALYTRLQKPDEAARYKNDAS
jgi:tetratricopeptide (TPR) repeat protein